MHIYYAYILFIVFIYHYIINRSYFWTGIIMRHDKLLIVKEHSFFYLAKLTEVFNYNNYLCERMVCNK